MVSLLQEPEEYGYYGNYLADPSVRLAIHVGNLTYNDGTPVEKHLLNDIMASVKPWIAVLLNNYKVGRCHRQLLLVLYNGSVQFSNWYTLQTVLSSTLPPNSALTGYAIEMAVLISLPLSTKIIPMILTLSVSSEKNKKILEC